MEPSGSSFGAMLRMTPTLSRDSRQSPHRLSQQDASCPVGRAGLSCLVVGAAPGAAELLRLLRANSNVGRVVAAPDAAAALRVLHHVDVDVAFIELRMPGIAGGDLAGVLNRFRAAPAIVFTAQGPEGAVDAFDLGAVDYLTRPIPSDRLDRSVRRVLANRGTIDTVPADTGVAPIDDEMIAVCLAGTTRLVPRSSVRWAEARRDYVCLHTGAGSYLIRARMSTLAHAWSRSGLIRIHRSYLVRLDSVEEVQTSRSGHLTVLIDGHRLPVSRRVVPNLWHIAGGPAPAGGAGPR
jgi:DNA-binding LytR/AlgR family response regulator